MREKKGRAAEPNASGGIPQKRVNYGRVVVAFRRRARTQTLPAVLARFRESYRATNTNKGDDDTCTESKARKTQSEQTRVWKCRDRDERQNV